jgi:hypothetical protein
MNDTKVRTIKLVIDSRDRENASVDNPSSYTYKSITDLNNVESINLVYANIPFRRYLIHSYNKYMYYSVDVGVTGANFSLTEGNYTETELAALLTSGFTSNGSSVTVSYDDNTDKLTFTSTDALILYFDVSSTGVPTNALYRVLGFDRKNYSISGTTIVAPYRVNLSDDKYIILTIDNATAKVSNHSEIGKAFALIYKNSTGDVNKYIGDNFLQKVFTPPINNLNQWRIRFSDYDGNLYDFQQCNHQLEFSVNCIM